MCWLLKSRFKLCVVVILGSVIVLSVSFVWLIMFFCDLDLLYVFGGISVNIDLGKIRFLVFSVVSIVLVVVCCVCFVIICVFFGCELLCILYL